MRMPSILKKVVKMLHLEKDASEQKKSCATGKGRLLVQNDPLEFLISSTGFSESQIFDEFSL